MNTADGAILACDRLSMHFGGLAALDCLSLKVPRGAIVGLIGPNGSGKTTFFNVVTGIYAPSAGTVHFADRDITALRPQQVYRAGIARTFQRSRLCLPLSIFDNLMIGNHQRLSHGLWFNLLRRSAFRQQYQEVLQEARSLAHTFNPTLAERMFEAVGSFPMIDRRRIEVCRALISHPTLLLLDEPSAGMTHEETHQLMDDLIQVRDRMPGLTIVIIEHEMNVIERITDHVVVLNFGEKICEGTYQQVAADKLVQEAYLGVE